MSSPTLVQLESSISVPDIEKMDRSDEFTFLGPEESAHFDDTMEISSQNGGSLTTTSDIALDLGDSYDAFHQGDLNTVEDSELVRPTCP